MSPVLSQVIVSVLLMIILFQIQIYPPTKLPPLGRTNTDLAPMWIIYEYQSNLYRNESMSGDLFQHLHCFILFPHKFLLIIITPSSKNEGEGLIVSIGHMDSSDFRIILSLIVILECAHSKNSEKSNSVAEGIGIWLFLNIIFQSTK